MKESDHDPGLLDEQAQASLRAYREVHEPPALVKARVQRRLRAHEAATARRVKLRGWALASLAAAALLLLVARSLLPGQAGAPGAGARGEVAPYTQVVREDTAAAREQGSIAAEPAHGTQDEGQALGEPAAEVGLAAIDEAARPASPRRPAPERPPAAVERPVAVDLAAERRLLEAAWRALTLGDHARALASTRQHREDHPEGVLSPERAAIEAIARCNSGAPSAAAGAAHFAASHGQSPWLAQVRAACLRP